MQRNNHEIAPPADICTANSEKTCALKMFSSKTDVILLNRGVDNSLNIFFWTQINRFVAIFKCGSSKMRIAGK